MNQDIFVIIEHLQGHVTDISYIMMAAARQLAHGIGGNVVAVLLGNEAQGLAHNFAVDQVLYINHPVLANFTSDAYTKILNGVISDKQPHVVLFGSTSIGADLASVLSAQLGLPMVSSCHHISSDGKFVSQICGGKIMSESILPEQTTLVSMIPGGYKPEAGQTEISPKISSITATGLEGLRITLSKYIEPETGDVDISKESILVAVGRGIQNKDNIELAEELAQALGGVVCGSRPVVDQGWLATTRLVGKSGQTVKPKVYLALGISGAPEHVEGITGSDVIIAINTDPAAPIFGLAKYGIEADMFDLLPVLTEQVQLA